MKYSILVTLVLVLSLPNTLQAAPSKGKRLTICKQQVVQTLGEDTRIRIKKIRSKKITLIVRSPSEGKKQTVVCELVKDSVRLTKLDGTVVAKQN